ncbi:MAG: hemolysin III family protein [Clostridia bacterium]|nr:hemolysin III family protein [Clostridia bacterium]
MKRTKLENRILPTYTKGEEIFNMVSHIVGGVAGIVTIVLCSVFGAIRHNPYGIISGIIFGVSMIFLYTMSSIYHGLSPNLKSKKVFQVLDHCAIFVLIAGSYTPFALCTLRSYSTALGWTIFGVIWGFAVLGIILNSIDLKKYKIFSMFCYLAMGWCIIVKGNILPETLSIPGFALLLAGGIIYTIGAILYGIGKKYKYVHSLFHIFVFLGNILHVLCVLMYVI